MRYNAENECLTVRRLYIVIDKHYVHTNTHFRGVSHDRKAGHSFSALYRIGGIFVHMHELRARVFYHNYRAVRALRYLGEMMFVHDYQTR